MSETQIDRQQRWLTRVKAIKDQQDALLLNVDAVHHGRCDVLVKGEELAVAVGSGDGDGVEDHGNVDQAVAD